MKFFVGLAALTYTLGQVHPLVWFALFLGGVAVVATAIAFWPVVLLVVIAVGTLWIVAQVRKAVAK